MMKMKKERKNKLIGFGLLLGLIFVLVIQGCPTDNLMPMVDPPRDTNAEAVAAAKTALSIGYAAGDNVNNVTTDVTLTNAGADGVTISWASDNVAIATDGMVTRPDNDNTDVTLTATLTKGDASDTREFRVRVIISDVGAVAVAKNALDIIYMTNDSAAGVRANNVTFPASGANGVSITWISSNTNIISSSGEVTRPNDIDTEVIITATLSKGSANDTKDFTVTVILLTDSNAVALAKAALEIGYAEIDNSNSVRSDVMLSLTGNQGVSIAWASGDESVITSNGAVTRPTGADADVILTATLSKGSASDTKVFTIPVIQVAATSGVAKVFADTNIASVDALSIMKDSANGPDVIGVTFPTSGGANGTDNYLRFTENSDDSAGAWAVLFWEIFTFYNMDAGADAIGFSFYVRSSNVTSIAAKLEDSSGGASEVFKGFTADGTWQKITWLASDFSTINRTSLDTIVIVPGVSTTTETAVVDIDEVQFVMITDAEIVAATKNSLEIGYGGGNDATRVTENVTLPTSLNGVTISWASDNLNFISTTGVVSRTNLTTNVMLTATLEKGGVTDTKEFTLTVVTTLRRIGNVKVFADGDSAGFPQIFIADGTPNGEAGSPPPVIGNLEVTQTTTGTGGADGSVNFTSLNLTSAGSDYAIYQWILSEPYEYNVNVPALQVNFKFAIKSPVGGVNKIKVKFERAGVGGDTTPEVEMSFTADGTWQEVSYPLSLNTFASSPHILSDIWKIVFVLSDNNGGTAGIGAQSFDLDEVRFEENTNFNVAVVYSDNEAIDIATTSVVGFSQDGTRHTLTETTTGNDGANNSTDYYTLEITDGSTTLINTGLIITFANAYNVLAGSDIAFLTFSIRSTDGRGAGGDEGVFRLQLEKSDGGLANGVASFDMFGSPAPRTFVADGTWQQVSVPMVPSIFGGDHTAWLVDIKKLHILVEDVNGTSAGVGAQTIDIDEIRFESQ